MKIALCSIFIVSLMTAQLATASTFYVNRAIGSGGVTGTIQTDGTLGVISGRNIRAWNLVLDDGVDTVNLVSGVNSEVTHYSIFTATATDLLFDFSNVLGDSVHFQGPVIGSGRNYWCLEGANGGCVNFSSAETVRVTKTGPQQVAQRAGLVSFATTTVPEPTTLLLMGLGLLGFVKRRRFRISSGLI